jgi:Zn-dependent protease with chaperone function
LIGTVRAAAAAALLFAAPASASDDAVADLLVLQSVEARVASIGYRLQTSAGDLCGEQAMLSGIQIHDASQYERSAAPALAAAFGAGGWPRIFAVARGSAAERGGAQPNDTIVRIDGEPPPAAPNGMSYARVGATLDMLDRAMADGHLVLTVARDGGAPLDLTIEGQRGCASRFQVKISNGMQGEAEGRYVEVTTGLVAFAPDEAELAAAIAHELAHNILRHRAWLDANNVKRGILQNFGRSARLTRETEVAADRLSVHLLDRAGYPTAAAVRFWDRFRKAIFDFGDQTHPGGKERVAVLTAEIAKIEAAKAVGLVPRFEP